jgi:hypothetical protein
MRSTSALVGRRFFFCALTLKPDWLAPCDGAKDNRGRGRIWNSRHCGIEFTFWARFRRYEASYAAVDDALMLSIMLNQTISQIADAHR